MLNLQARETATKSDSRLLIQCSEDTRGAFCRFPPRIDCLIAPELTAAYEVLLMMQSPSRRRFSAGAKKARNAAGAALESGSPDWDSTFLRRNLCWEHPLPDGVKSALLLACFLFGLRWPL